MSQRKFYIQELTKGSNSVLFETMNGAVLYEKLANTIHSGNKKNLENFFI